MLKNCSFQLNQMNRAYPYSIVFFDKCSLCLHPLEQEAKVVEDQPWQTLGKKKAEKIELNMNHSLMGKKTKREQKKEGTHRLIGKRKAQTTKRESEG